MLISKKMEEALNEQVIYEAEASFKYLAMASWCDTQGLEGSAEFFYSHATEENQHMMKIFLFVNEVGGHAIVPAVKQPKSHFKSVLDVCEQSLKNEQFVTKSINKLVALAMKENDHVTHDFMRFYIEEQKEEEILFMRLIDRIKLIGDGPQSLFYIDNELKKWNKLKTAAEGGEAEKAK